MTVFDPKFDVWVSDNDIVITLSGTNYWSPISSEKVHQGYSQRIWFTRMILAYR